MNSGTQTAYASPDSDRAAIGALADELFVNVIYGEPEKTDSPVLRISEDGLSLSENNLTVCGDFSRMLSRVTGGHMAHEVLLKAAKIKSFGENPVAIDATAGLGEDAFLLAAAGFSVRLYEYNQLCALLLKDALRRALLMPETAAIVSRMELFCEDSVAALPSLGFAPELVLLDPMFPQREKSALVKKKFQLIHRIEKPCANEEELLSAARASGAKKIVIKRPPRGAFLAGVKPSYSIERNGIRFDCIVR